MGMGASGSVPGAPFFRRARPHGTESGKAGQGPIAGMCPESVFRKFSFEREK